MRKVILVASLVSTTVCYADALPQDVLLFAGIRGHVRAQLAQLLKCTCLQTSVRYRQQGSRSGQKHRIESSEPLTLEIAYIDGKEVFAWPGAGSFESRTISEIVAGGLTDTGGFSLFARSIFIDNAAVVKFRGGEDYQGHSAVRYDYSVKPLLSGYLVKSPAGTATVGYSGSFWADSKSLDLLRITVRADDLPMSLKLNSVTTVIDYGQTSIHGSGWLLPQTVRTSMTGSSGDIVENLTDFTHCRRFTADATIFFASPSEEARNTVGKLETVVLPPGVTVTAQLNKSVDSETARVGDAVAARIEVPVVAKHHILVPVAAVLSGRVRRVEKFTRPNAFVLLALEFTDFSFGNSHGILFAEFERSNAGTPAQAAFPLASVTSYRMNLLWLGHEDSRSLEEFTNRDLPGVATFYCAGSRCRVPAGTEMIWKSEPLAAHRSR